MPGKAMGWAKISSVFGKTLLSIIEMKNIQTCSQHVYIEDVKIFLEMLVGHFVLGYVFQFFILSAYTIYSLTNVMYTNDTSLIICDTTNKQLLKSSE